MSPVGLPMISANALAPERLTTGSLRDEAWVTAARRARALSWASLAWMTMEGVIGLIAGLDASASASSCGRHRHSWRAWPRSS
jgi:hypothetical protein